MSGDLPSKIRAEHEGLKADLAKQEAQPAPSPAHTLGPPLRVRIKTRPNLETPRTDEFVFRRAQIGRRIPEDEQIFLRQLESELAQANRRMLEFREGIAQFEDMKRELARRHALCVDYETKWKAETKALKLELARLRIEIEQATGWKGTP